MKYFMFILILSASAVGQWTMSGGSSAPPPPPPPAQCGNAGAICPADCSYQLVNAAVGQAQPGDTVVLPVCASTTISSDPASNSWTQTLSITKAINIVGQGMDQTVIINNIVPRGAGIATINLNNGVSDPAAIRISGFTLQEGSPITTGSPSLLSVTTGSQQLRIDHIHMTNLGQTYPATGSAGGAPCPTGIRLDGNEVGVVDHVWWEGNCAGHIYMSHSSWGGVGANGDNSWAQPDTIGTANAMYVEDSFDLTINSNSKAYSCDQPACRGVYRHNVLPFWGTHGTESGQRNRGMRHAEIYNNLFQCNATSGIGTSGIWRSGIMIVFNNTITNQQTVTQRPDGTYFTSPVSTCFGSAGGGGFNVELVRERTAFAPWGSDPNRNMYGSCDGASPFDKNDNQIFLTGTATSGSTADVLEDTTKSWTTNQWIGYNLRNVTIDPNYCQTTNRPPPNGTGPSSGSQANVNTPPSTIGQPAYCKFWGSFVASNTATTITTVSSLSGYGEVHNWQPGDQYEIRRATNCIDNIGGGQSAYLSGGSGGGNPLIWTIGTCQPGQGSIPGCTRPDGTTNATTGWVNQAHDPGYLWSNKKTTSAGVDQPYYAELTTRRWANVRTETPPIAENVRIFRHNRDWYEESNNWNGTFGVGVGTKAQIPATCTPEVGYWATDEQELYKCTATNTWTAFYHPYVYPHPLQAVATLDHRGRLIETGDGHLSPKLVRKAKLRHHRKHKHSK